MDPHDPVRRTLGPRAAQQVADLLAPVDAELARRYPGDPGTRQPVHTVYVPADAFTADTVRTWGDQALAALDAHAPDAASFAAALDLDPALAAE
ncbi:aldolase, partial [Streptomyces sp. SID11233]|nr:aldolase [Streptomyces sp. SID11233]